jgi:hypothetical protein
VEQRRISIPKNSNFSFSSWSKSSVVFTPSTSEVKVKIYIEVNQGYGTSKTNITIDDYLYVDDVGLFTMDTFDTQIVLGKDDISPYILLDGGDSGIIQTNTNYFPNSDWEITPKKYVDKKSTRYVSFRVVGKEDVVEAGEVDELALPLSGTLVEVGAFLNQYSTSGSVVVDLKNKSGNSYLTTPIRIPQYQDSSFDYSIQPVISSGSTLFSRGDWIVVDILEGGTSASGLDISLVINTNVSSY